MGVPNNRSNWFAIERNRMNLRQPVAVQSKPGTPAVKLGESSELIGVESTYFSQIVGRFVSCA